jgi:phosphatidyl-myo-inositol dimannoside synthase
MRVRLLQANAFGGVADFWFGPRAERSKTRDSLGLAPETVALVTVANLTRRKGHLVTLAALLKLSPLLCKRVSWLVVGSNGEPDYANELKAAIASSGCDVRLMGALESQQIRDVYGASDLFCLTPDEDLFEPTQEYSLVYLEAAACGLPSIATAFGDATDAVIDNQTGRVVAPTVGAIADAIAELTMDGIKRVSLGKRAWMRAREMSRDRCVATTCLPLLSTVHVEQSPEKVRGHSTIEVAK